MDKQIKMEEMNSPDIKTAIENGMNTVVFAVGSNEQHGPCLPVCTDTLIGDTIAFLVAQKLGNALKGPTVNMGSSDHHMKFPGTVTLKKSTLQNVIKDYCASLAQHGFKQIIIIPSHGGNFAPLDEIKDELQTANPNIKVFSYTDIQHFIDTFYSTSEKLGISIAESGGHAGEFEVSLMLSIRSDLVKKDRIPEAIGYLGEITEKVRTKLFSKGMGAVSPIGVLGSPVKSKKEHGKIYFEDMANSIVKYISDKMKPV